MDKKHIFVSILLALPFLGVNMSPLGGTWTASIIIWSLFLILLVIYNRKLIKQRFRGGKSPALKVTIPYIKIGRMVSSNSFILLVTLKFEPSEPIPLSKLDFVYKPSALFRHVTSSPLGGLPTKLVERVETYEVKYEISGFRGDLLIETGLREKKNIPESQWPQAYLHVLAGNLDFNTDKVPMPTPTWMLASGKEGSQN